MFGGFVGMMVLDGLVSRFHRSERGLRGSKAQCAGQDGQSQYGKEALHIPTPRPTSPSLYLYHSKSSSTKLSQN
jgi:hypothetical protein